MANPFVSEGFTRQNRQVFTKISASTATSHPHKRSTPSTIILCTWMSAHPRHIKSYILNYTTLFPHSHILLILSPKTPLIFFSPAAQRTQLLPAVQFLAADESKKFIVHIFSGGGAVSLCNLAVAYRDHANQKEQQFLPIQKLFLDSTPAQIIDSRTADAWVHVLPPALKGKTATLLARYFLRWLWIFALAITRFGDPFARAWRDLNDVRVIREESERVYIYSEDDELIWYEDVLKHSEIASQRGFMVRKERFEGSGHVVHALGDKERYWGIVGRF